MRVYVEYSRSLRCLIGLHDQGDAEHGCQGGFKPILGRSTRFCLCKCHDAPMPEPVLTFQHERQPDGTMRPVLNDPTH